MMDRCPACDADSYLLADGRRQCRKCRQKFTPHPRQGRLSEATREAVAQLFWDLGSAYRAADLAGINRKTVQRIYREFRVKMALENDGLQNATHLREVQSEGCPMSEPMNLLCGIGVNDRTVWVAFPERGGSGVPHACCSTLVLGAQYGAKENFLSRVLQKHLPHGSEGELRVAAEFWEFARRHLRRYRGSFRDEFPLYLKEMVFRFNNPEKKKALDILLRS